MTVKWFNHGKYVSESELQGANGFCNVCGKHTYTIGDIAVDCCIGKEIEQLINAGIKTQSCCCGHHEMPPWCLIDTQSNELAISLGYQPDILSEYQSAIKLKAKTKEGD